MHSPGIMTLSPQAAEMIWRGGAGLRYRIIRIQVADRMEYV